MTDPRLDGDVVLVTGGSRGLGRSMARAAAAAGARVAITASRASDALESTRAELAAIGGTGNVLAVAADARDAAQCAHAVAAVVERFGRIDALVNNAGIGMRHISETFNTAPPRFWEAPVDAWRDIMETNLFGAFFTARAVAPHLVGQKRGRIVNVGTSPITMVRKGYSPYGPSKAGLEAMTRIWAQDLAGTGVTCNLLLPGGATDTDFLPGTGAARRGADGMLLPVDVLDRPLVWLLSSAAADVTGRRIVGRLWDRTLPDAEAATAAMQPVVELPSIL